MGPKYDIIYNHIYSVVLCSQQAQPGRGTFTMCSSLWSPLFIGLSNMLCLVSAPATGLQRPQPYRFKRECNIYFDDQHFANPLCWNDSLLVQWIWNIYLHLPQTWPSFVGKYSTHGAHGMINVGFGWIKSWTGQICIQIPEGTRTIEKSPTRQCAALHFCWIYVHPSRPPRTLTRASSRAIKNSS